ncbi:MAG TPA: hypothetical protein VJK51_00525 [Candidatus Nanoarchaeia archaeon]|nr:hypothetical protein [Candidatus Nanoarchaeia archaeon]
MPRISQKKQDKIAEQMLHVLFQSSPAPLFTATIAQETARDEEFTKTILHQLKTKGLVQLIKKNAQGVQYQQRQRWRLTNEAFNAYQKQQTAQKFNL